MQALMETLFDIAYLAGALIMGIMMIRDSKGCKQIFLFGMMTVVLAAGDSFHLVARAYALWTTGLEANAAALGFGKLVTSITMTVFYIILYHIWCERYHCAGKKGLTYTLYGLAVVRIALCLFPQNQWLCYNAPVSWGILRNIPFAIIGIIIIVLFFQQAKKTNDRPMRFMWLAITLSFALYIPVVLWADVFPLVGILMIPKTLAYVWIVLMGFAQSRRICGTSLLSQGNVLK